DSRRIRTSSVPSLISVPPYLLKMISSPSSRSILMYSPSSSRAPGPTARTRPRCGFSFAVSGSTMPLTVVSSSSRTSTVKRSPSGCRFIHIPPVQTTLSHLLALSHPECQRILPWFGGAAQGADTAVLQSPCAQGVLCGWDRRPPAARPARAGRDPPGGQAGRDVGAAERPDRAGRTGRAHGSARGCRGDRPRCNTGREARRHPLRLHLGRRARFQGRELLPLQVSVGASRRHPARARARGRGGEVAPARRGAGAAGLQRRARDGREGTRPVRLPRVSEQGHGGLGQELREEETRLPRGRRGGRRRRPYATLVLGIVAIVLLILLIARNTRQVRVDYVFGHWEAALIWLVVISTITGWVLGIVTAYLVRRRTRWRRPT